MTQKSGAAPHRNNTTARLLIPVQPYEDESVSGLVVRAADTNYVGTSDILSEAGTLYTKGIEPIQNAENLASCLGVPLNVVEDRAIFWSTERDDFVSYFGAEFRSTHFNFSRYAFSPKALEISLHHRARWHFSSFPYCTESWSVLRHTCPRCDMRLAWRGRDSLIPCGWCTHDLRKSPAEKLGMGVRPALLLLSQLLSTNPNERQTAIRAFPAEFHEFSENTIFNVVIHFAHAQTDIPVGRRGPNGGLTAEHLARGCDIALQFPGSFKRIAKSRSRDNQTISPFFTKLAAPHALRADPLLKEVLLREMARVEPLRHGPTRLRYLRDAEGHVSTTIAARTLRIDRSATSRLLDAGHLETSRARGLTRRCRWIEPNSLADLAARFADRISATELESILGAPREAIEQLAGVGLLVPLGDPAADLVFPGLQMKRAPSEALLQSLSRVVAPSREERMMSLRDTFTAIGNQQKPWAAIILAAIAGRLPEPLSVDGDARLRIEDLLVPEALARDLAHGRYPELLKIPEFGRELGQPVPLNRLEVERYLNCFPRDVSWLMARKHLTPRSSEIRRFSRVEVARLGASLISSREISWRWRVSPAFRDDLERRVGISRALGPFWPRPEVIAYFQRRFPSGRPVE